MRTINFEFLNQICNYDLMKDALRFLLTRVQMFYLVRVTFRYSTDEANSVYTL